MTARKVAILVVPAFVDGFDDLKAVQGEEVELGLVVDESAGL